MHARFNEFFWKIFIIAMNINETICCENILITCFASCLDVNCDLKNAIQIFSCKNFLWRFVLDHLRCDSRSTIQIFLMQKLFVTIRFRNFAWLFHRQCFWLSSLDSTNDACSLSTHWMTYVCSRCIERRVLVFDLSSDVCIFDEMTQTIIFY